jgi:hypothetical protein
MLCRNCRTEIADNALICYRCGTAVDELPPVRPAARRRRRVGLFRPTLALIVLVVAALLVGRATVEEFPVATASAVLVLAVIVVGWWLRARRRR